MIYTHNNHWRSTMLIDGTAEAKLADVLFIMENETFGQRKAASYVGGLGRLFRLIEEGKIRSDKPTNRQNGKWFCNAADVQKYAVVKRAKPKSTRKSVKKKKDEKNNSQHTIA